MGCVRSKLDWVQSRIPCLKTSESGSRSKRSKKAEKEAPPLTTEAPKTVDPRLPFETYRQLFNLKNSWKAVSRKLEEVAKDNMQRFLQSHPEYKKVHPELEKFDTDEKMYASDDFESVAVEIYNNFDVAMETMDGNVDASIATFKAAGQAFKLSPGCGYTVTYIRDMEETFVAAAREVLGDRFTEPTERNFHLLYQFAAERMIEGYNDATSGRHDLVVENRI